MIYALDAVWEVLACSLIKNSLFVFGLIHISFADTFHMRLFVFQVENL